MMGLGCDIVDIHRIQKALGRYGSRFTRRLFTESECQAAYKKKHPERRFATRFAAKEAFLKALGTGIHRAIGWHDMEVLNDAWGKPYIQVHGGLKSFFDAQKAPLSIHVTLSDTHDLAMAMVLIAPHGSVTPAVVSSPLFS